MNGTLRYKLFQIAEAHTGITVMDYAAKYGCTVQHIYQVLKGDRKSQIIEQDIESHIFESLNELQVTIPKYKEMIRLAA